jgi:hypothetical protein
MLPLSRPLASSSICAGQPSFLSGLNLEAFELRRDSLSEISCEADFGTPGWFSASLRARAKWKLRYQPQVRADRKRYTIPNFMGYSSEWINMTETVVFKHQSR